MFTGKKFGSSKISGTDTHVLLYNGVSIYVHLYIIYTCIILKIRIITMYGDLSSTIDSSRVYRDSLCAISQGIHGTYDALQVIRVIVLDVYYARRKKV